MMTMLGDLDSEPTKEHFFNKNEGNHNERKERYKHQKFNN